MILRTSGAVYTATERNIQEDLNLQHHRWQNFKSRNNCLKFAPLSPLILMLGVYKPNSANFGPYSALILNSLKYIAKLFSP